MPIRCIKEEMITPSVSFCDICCCFQSKTNYELFRALFVLHLCSYETLVKNNKAILKALRIPLGQNLFNKLLRATFFGQFVAGESREEVIFLCFAEFIWQIVLLLHFLFRSAQHVTWWKKRTLFIIVLQKSVYLTNEKEYFSSILKLASFSTFEFNEV